MVIIFEFEDNNHGFVAAILQQEIEKYFPVVRRGSRNLPEFEENFQGGIFQKGLYKNDLNKETFVWLLLGVTRKRDHSRLRRVMMEKSGQVETIKFNDVNELKEYLFTRPELSLQWFSEN